MRTPIAPTTPTTHTAPRTPTDSYLFIFLLNKYIKAAALKIYLGKSTIVC